MCRKADTIKVSFIIPAYNEASRIGDTLRDALAFFHAQNFDWEIIVVDDGSSDDTVKVAQEFQDKDADHLRIFPLQENQGKGAAVRKGMLEAQGEVRIFSDADASTPVKEVLPLLDLINKGADVAIASRALPDSDVQVHQSWYRERMGRIFNVILRSFALTPFRDTQCGFKGFTANAAQILFPRQRTNHFSFDVELLYIARLHNLQILELPVTWRNSPRSTVNPITDSAKMLLDMFRIRLNALRGLYR